MMTLVRQEKMDALRYGRLEIISKAASRNGQVYMLCRCDCGKEKEIALSSLKRGLTQSCGCYRRDKGPGNQSHKQTYTRTYKVWLSMRQRCLNPNNPAYKNYGGRGITIAPEWDSYQRFWEDMGDVPDGMSIERIDNDGNYEPGNCRWATRLEQGRNTRKCRAITFQGTTKTITEWAEQYGLQKSTLSQRIRNGWDMERALTQSPLAYHNRSA